MTHFQKYKYALIGIAILLGCYMIYVLRPSPPSLTSNPLVRVTKVIQGDRTEKLRLIGTVVAPESVSIRSRLDSQITKIFIQNGQTVQKGDKLVQLDDRSLKAQLDQIKANLDSNKAELIRAEKKYQRDTELAKRGVAAKETLDQSTQMFLSAKAALTATEAQIVNLETQIDYANIRSPLDGVVGTIAITEGNLVRANDTNAIMTIKKINPINVDIQLPQRYYDVLKNRFNKLEIAVQYSESNPPKKSTGVILENSIDTTARNLTLRTELENSDRTLWPGMFVNVIIDLNTYQNATIIPIKSIMHTQNDQQVYVVSSDNTAHLHPVKVLFSNETEAIVESDLKEGDDVITDGGFNVKPESLVTVVKDSNK